MPENIKALIVILTISTIFYFYIKPHVSSLVGDDSFKLNRNIWLLFTTIAFLSQNFWIYALIAAPFLIYVRRTVSNPVSLYFALIFVIPSVPYQIPGFAGINYIFALTNARMIVLLVLLPTFLVMHKQKNYVVFGNLGTDKILAAYIVLQIVMNTINTTFTDSMRQSFYLFTDIFLPYVVISRSIKNMQNFREIMSILLLSIMILAPIAIFESKKYWILYSSVNPGGATDYLDRDGLLRAIATSGQAIVLGYMMVVGIGFYLFLRVYIKKNLVRWLGLLLLIGGLIAPFSRGPWLGASLLLLIFILSGRNPVKHLMKILSVGILSLTLLFIAPEGEKYLNLLPFIGTTDSGNVSYRTQLLNNSLIVIERNFWFGSSDYLKTPEMEAMRQGQGIIDIVNTYLQAALAFGVVGLGLFVGYFMLVIMNLIQAVGLIRDKQSEMHLLGRALIAILISILLMLVSVSSITFVPILYWICAALGVAYTQMVRSMPT